MSVCLLWCVDGEVPYVHCSHCSLVHHQLRTPRLLITVTGDTAVDLFLPVCACVHACMRAVCMVHCTCLCACINKYTSPIFYISITKSN